MGNLNIKGIDISSWQGNINLQDVKNAGVEVVYIKATEGENYIDSMLNTYYQEAKNVGLKIGFYHFLHPNDDGEIQAQFMYNQIKNLNYDCKIAIDIEVTNGESNLCVNQCIMDFANEIKVLTNSEPIVYSDLNFANTVLDDSISTLGFWQAEYDVSKATPSKIFGTNILGWQYSDSGNFGESTDLDLFSEEIFSSFDKEDNFNVGDMVKISPMAICYVTGQMIPNWVKEEVYRVSEVIGQKLLLQEIESWVYCTDVLKVNYFNVGDKVKLILESENYVTGQVIPDWVKANIYTIEQIRGQEVLLQEIESWVYKYDLILI